MPYPFLLKIFLLTQLICLGTNMPSPSVATTCLVKVHGLRNTKGSVMLAVFKDEVGFPSQTQHAVFTDLKRANEPIEFRLSGLQAGQYAISLLHDENQDGTLNCNFFGKPLEGYGFSNNAKGWFGPPSFESSKFQLPQKTVLEINLTYF